MLSQFLVRTKLRVAAEKVRQSVAVLRGNDAWSVQEDDSPKSPLTRLQSEYRQDPAERDAHGRAAEPASAYVGSSKDLQDDNDRRAEQEALEGRRAGPSMTRSSSLQEAREDERRREAFHAAHMQQGQMDTTSPKAVTRLHSVPSPSPMAGCLGRRSLSVESPTAVGHTVGAQQLLLPEVVSLGRAVSEVAALRMRRASSSLVERARSTPEINGSNVPFDQSGGRGYTPVVVRWRPRLPASPENGAASFAGVRSPSALLLALRSRSSF